MINWKVGYRHYNTLMDVAFWVLFVAYARGLLRRAGVPGAYLLDTSPSANLALGVIFLILQLLLILLIVIPHWRDEYAERLWQKAAATFVKMLPLFPLLWFVGISVASDHGNLLDWLRANPDIGILPDHALLTNPGRSIGIHQFEGVNFVILKITQYFPLIFAGMFKWHRWRDEA